MQRCWDLGQNPRISGIAHGSQSSLPSSEEQVLTLPSRASLSNIHAEGRLSGRLPSLIYRRASLVTYPRAGIHSSHFPGGIRDNITPQWVLPSHFAKHFHFLSEPLRALFEAGQCAGHFADVKTEAQTGHVVCPRSRCKETAESNETLAFQDRVRLDLQLGPLHKSLERNSAKSLLHCSSFSPEMTTSLPNSTE